MRATLIHSEITANGSVVRVPEKQGHLITLDVVSPKARLEDLLQLSTKSNQPMMTGMVNLKTKLILPPGKVKVLDKLALDGEFTVSDGRFASSDVRDKLAAFSRHAQGQRLPGPGRRQPVAVARPVPLDRLLQAILVRRRPPPQLALGLAVGERPAQRGRPDLDRARELDPRKALASLGALIG